MAKCPFWDAEVNGGDDRGSRVVVDTLPSEETP